MSVRSRIAQFEELSCTESKDDSQKDKKNETQTRKRFRHPGNARKLQEPEPPMVMGIGAVRGKGSGGVSDLEADLQEVWSVRRNVHHTGKSRTVLPSTSVIAGKYSRHGAIPAQQSQAPQSLAQLLTSSKVIGLSNKEDFSYGRRRSPLQEHNPRETPWNVRAAIFSYSEPAAKRPMEPSPSTREKDVSPPRAKRRPNMDTSGGVRPTYDERLHAFPPKKTKVSGEKVGYAKKMAQGYLKSVGSGDYTPKYSAYTRENMVNTGEGQPHWTLKDDQGQDEFDF